MNYLNWINKNKKTLIIALLLTPETGHIGSKIDSNIDSRIYYFNLERKYEKINERLNKYLNSPDDERNYAGLHLLMDMKKNLASKLDSTKRLAFIP